MALELERATTKKVTPSWQTNIMQSKNKRMGLVRKVLEGSTLKGHYNQKDNINILTYTKGPFF